MWLHPLMNPCQFPACSRQLPMQRASSPPPSPPLTPMYLQLLCCTLSIYRTGCMKTLHFCVPFTLPLSLLFSLPLFLPSWHSVHCPLSIVRCPLSVCRVPVCQRDTFHSCSRLGFRFCPAPFLPHATASSALMTCCSDMDATSAAATPAAAVHRPGWIPRKKGCANVDSSSARDLP